MQQNEKERALFCDLDNVIRRHATENNLTYAQVVGVLAVLSHEMMCEERDDDIEMDDEDEGDGSQNGGDWTIRP